MSEAPPPPLAVPFTQAMLDRLNELEARQAAKDAWVFRLNFVLTAFAMFMTAVWAWHDFSQYMWPPAPGGLTWGKGGFLNGVGPPGQPGPVPPGDAGLCNVNK